LAETENESPDRLIPTGFESLTSFSVSCIAESALHWAVPPVNLDVVVICSKPELEVTALSDLSPDLVEAARNAICFAEGSDERYGWPHSRRSHVCVIDVDRPRR